MTGKKDTEAAAVIGQGYVGLPLALALADSGLKVWGVDHNSELVSELTKGKSHIDDVSEDLLKSGLRNGYLPTTDMGVIGYCRTVVVCVPTPLDQNHKPDLSILTEALAHVVERVSAGTLVILESTSYPGTTQEMIAGPLEKRGFTIGKDVFVAFSPERIDPSNAAFTVRNTPRVVGGVTAACSEQARFFYSRFVDEVHIASGPREAEMAKLLENTYRHVNIALINEFAKVCHALGIDVWEVLAAAATKPFGFQAFYPGPGVGGHCIPIDPHYLNEKVLQDLGYPLKFVELAYAVNSSMPTYVCDRVQHGASLRAGDSLLLVGVTYKPDVADTRETPATDIALGFLEAGYSVEYWDPLVPVWVVGGHEMRSVASLLEAAEEAQAVVLLQNHSATDLESLVAISSYIFDTRGVLHGPSVERI